MSEAVFVEPIIIQINGKMDTKAAKLKNIYLPIFPIFLLLFIAITCQFELNQG